MKRKSPRQLHLFLPPPKDHGGQKSLGKRKVARPISTKSSMHVIFRSEQARGELSLLRKKRSVEIILHQTAKRFHVKVIKFANVGNHVHCLIRGKTRDGIKNFLRVFPQAVAFLLTGTRKGSPLPEKFWGLRPFSRIVSWGREMLNMLIYLEKNIMEGNGIPREVQEAWIANAKAADG